MQRFSRVSVVPETGDFAIVWDGLGPATVEYNGDAVAEETIATGGGVFGQRFLANGTHFGNLFRVNSSLLGPQRLAGIAVRSREDSSPSNHSLFVAWSGEGTQTLAGQDDGQGVFYQRYQRYSEFSPIADAGGPYSMLEGEPLRLDASDSKVPAGRVTFSWDLNGDGDFSDASGIGPTVNWSDLVALGIQDDGEFVVRLHLEHDAGGLSDAESVLMVANVAPSASIGNIPDSVHVGLPFTLLAAAVDASPVDKITFIWHVTRDGKTLAVAAGETLTFTPVALGEFTVTLIARDDDLGATVAQLTLTAAPCLVLGDTDGDCSVGLTDLNNVRNNFGKSGPQVLGDADGNGVVDLIDLNAVRNNFGAGSDDSSDANALSHAYPPQRKSKARMESNLRWLAVKAVEADLLFTAIGGEAILDLAKPRRYCDRARV